jgi:hypothetical protein
MRTLLLCVLLLPVIGQGQITITQSDFGSSGDTIRYSIATDVWGLNPGLSGANVTWDFSMMTPTVQRIDTLYTTAQAGFTYGFVYGNPMNPSYLASWNRKELAIDLGGLIPIEDFRGFYRKASSALTYVGAGADIFGFPVPIRADSIERVYKFPQNYGDNFSEKRYLKADFPDLFYFEQRRDIENFTEGWGTLITPLGSFNVLKVRKEIIEYDTIFLDTLGFGFGFNQPPRTEYHWLGLNGKLPLMVYNQTGITGLIEYQDIPRAGTPVLSTEEVILPEIHIFPNPVSEVLTVKVNRPVEWIALVDMNGKLVIPPAPLLQDGIVVHHIASGQYNLLIAGKGMSFLETRPVVVQR